MYRGLVEMQERSTIYMTPGPPGLDRVLLSGLWWLWENDERNEDWFTEMGNSGSGYDREETLIEEW